MRVFWRSVIQLVQLSLDPHRIVRRWVSRNPDEPTWPADREAFDEPDPR